MHDELLTIEQAAKFFGVSPRTLRRWEQNGALKPMRTIGNQRRYSKSELSSLLRKPSVAPQQPVTPAPTPQPAASYIQKPELPKQRKVNSLTASLFGGATLGLWAIGILTLVLVSFPSFAGTFQGMNDRLNGGFVESNGNRQVLASTDKTSDFVLKFNAPAIFGKKVTFLDSFEIKNSLKVDKQSNLFGGINTNNSDINAGTGRLTASNIIYSLLAGTNIAITGDPQNPTVNAITSGVTTFQGQTGALTLTNGDGIGLNGLQVTNTGVLSLQGQSGAVTLNGDSGISVSGTSITNTDRGSSQNIFKVITAGGTDISAGSNNDQLTFAAGSGISITGDAGSKTVTITGSSTGLAGLTTNGVLYATSPTTATSTDVGTNGYILKSNGPGIAPNWVAPGTVLGNVQFDFIDSGTNTTAAMVVGSGASLGFTGSGTINASTLGGATFTAPGAIGSTTAGSGAFTTITGSSFNGLAVTNTGSNTLTIATGKTLAVNNSLTLAGTDGTSFTFPATSGTLVTTDATQTLTNKTIAAGSNTIIGLTNSNLSGSAGITNANLANASLTVTAGTGLSGGGVVSLGGSVSLNNAGVTGASAGTGISIDQATGNITITNNGVTSAIAGAGIGLDAGTGAVTISNNGVTSLTGTSNRVSVSGSTGAITLNLPQDIHTGANPTFAGLTLSSVTTNGGLLYTNGSGTVAQTSAGNVGECLTSNGGGTPTWSTCAAGSNMWQSNNGTVSPFSDTLDLLVGGTSTSSAKFAFINNTGGGTPTASISAGFFGSTYLTAYGELQTTSNNSLILGGNTTGNVLIPLNTDDRVGVGTNTPQARLHVYGDTRMGGDNDYVTITGFGDLSFTGNGDYLVGADDYAFRFSADEDYGIFFNATNTRYEFRDGNAARVFSVDANNGNMYSPGTLTGISGLTSSGTINFTGLTTNGGVLYTNGSGTVAQTSVGSLGECLTSNGGGAPGWSSCAAGPNLWQSNNGTVSPFSDTLDLLVGGTSTSSAKFAFINNSGSGTPTASISGTTTNVATYITGNGSLGTTNAQTLTLGTSSTGNVSLAPGGSAVLTALANGNVGIGTTTPNERLTVNGNIVGNADNSFLSIDDSNLNRFGITKKAGFTPMLTHGSGTNFVISRSSGTTINAVNTFTNEFLIDTSGNVGINTDTPTARLDVNGAASVSGSLSFQTGAGSIQTTANNTLTLGGSTTGDISFMPGNSSSSLYLSSNGNVGIGTTLPDEKLDVLGNFQIKDAETQTKAYRFRTNGGALDLEGAGAALYLSNWSGADFTGTQRNYLQVEDNVHEAHTQGKWMFKDGNTGLAGNELLTIDGPGTADVVINESGTNATDLRVEGDTDANLLFTQASTDSIGIGTNTPLAKLDVRGNSGTTPIASFTGSTAKAAIVVDQSGAGDLFTASASGTSRFTIANNGNIVGSGTLTGLTGLASSGTINLTSFTNNGGLLYTNGSGAVAQTSIGSLGQCLTSAGGGAPTWSSCAATNYWQLNSGTISPFSDTLDLLVGGTSTASAKFAFINNSGSGTPTASISAGTAGATYLTATGNIQTTANQTLSLGGSTTGNILLNSDNNNFVGIGHANPTSSLDVNGGITTRGSNSSLTMYSQDGGGNYYTLYSSAGELAFYNGAIRGALTSTGRLGLGFNNNVPQAQLDVQADTFSLPGGYIHGSTGKATLTLNQTSTAGDLFTASQSGSTKFVITNSGDVGIGTATPTYMLDIAGNTTSTNGVDIPAIRVSNASTATSSLSLFEASAGNGASIGRFLSSGVAGNQYSMLYTSTATPLILGTSGVERLRIDASGNVGINAQTMLATLDVRGILGTAPNASVSGATGNASMVVDQSGNGDLFTASKSGASKFTIKNNGDIQINNLTTAGGILYTNGTGTVTQTGAGTGTQCLLGGATPSWGSCATGVNLWQQNGGVISPFSNTLDLLVGGTSSTSAKFAIRNINSGTPIASISANSGNNAAYLTGDGTLATTNRANLTLGNSSTYNTTGNILLHPNSVGKVLVGVNTPLTSSAAIFQVNGTSSFNYYTDTADYGINVGGGIIFTQWHASDPYVNLSIYESNTGYRFKNNTSGGGGGDNLMTISGTGSLGLGTEDPLATLDVRGNSGTTPVASISGRTAKASMIVDQSGNGDIFTASKSGATKFVIANNGNVGIGVTNPTTTLQVGGTITVNGDILANASPTAGATSQTTTSIDTTNDTGKFTSMKIGADGLPVASYYDTTDTSLKLLKCTTADCSSSSVQLVDGFTACPTGCSTSASAGQYSSLAIGTDGFPVISYYDATGGALDLKVVKCGNASCSSGNTYTSIDTGIDSGQYSSIAIGVDGLPVISYYDNTSDDLEVVKCTTASCSSSSSATVDSSGDVGQYSGIVIGADGFPAIAYYEGTGDGSCNTTSECNPKFAKCLNLACSSSVAVRMDNATASNDAGQYISIGVMPQGNIHLSYYNTTGQVMRSISCSDSACDTRNFTNFDSATNTGQYTATAIGTDGLPVVSYYDVTNGNLKVGKCNANEIDFTDAVTVCQAGGAQDSFLTTVDSSANNVGQHTSIAIGTDGLPIVSYYDATSGNLKIVKCADKSCKNTSGGAYTGGSNIGSTGSFFNNVYANQFWGRSFQVTAFDVAEEYKVEDSSIQAGDVVRVSQNHGEVDSEGRGIVIEKTDKENDNAIVGVVSTNPAIRLGDWPTQDRTNLRPVALTGRVPVKIASNSASITAGDYLTSSAEKGRAMKSKKEGAVIGKALENWDPSSEKDTVLVFVNASYANPKLMITDTGNISLNGTALNTETLELAFDLVKAHTKTQIAASEASTSGKFVDLNTSVASNSAQLAALSNKVASLEAQIQRSAFTTNVPALVASSTAELGLDKLDGDSITLTNTLSVAGRTVLSDVGITGNLTAGLLKITGLDETGAASINTTSGPLMIQSTAYNGVNFLAGKVLIEPSGNVIIKERLTVKEINTTKLNIVDDQNEADTDILSASTGTVVLKAGQTSTEITTTALTPKSLIFATPDQPAVLGAKAKDKDTFTITLQDPQSTPIKVNWWIVN